MAFISTGEGCSCAAAQRRANIWWIHYCVVDGGWMCPYIFTGFSAPPLLEALTLSFLFVCSFQLTSASALSWYEYIQIFKKSESIYVRLQLSQQDWLMCSGRDPTVRFNLTGLRLCNHGAEHKLPHRRGFSHLNINPCPSDSYLFIFYIDPSFHLILHYFSACALVSVRENSLNIFPPAVNCPLCSIAQGQQQHWSTACSMILCLSLPFCISPLNLPSPPPLPLVLWMHHVALNDLFYGCYVARHAARKGWLHVLPHSVDHWGVDSLQQHSAALFYSFFAFFI